MKSICNIPIFCYGASANGFVIPEETVRKCIDTFKNAPIFIKDETDLFNKENNVIGVVNEVTDIKEPFVYGNIIIFNNENVEKFFNYGIQAEESHDEDGVKVIDKFTLNNVSLY
jgi:hypothetical protein